MTHGYKYAPRVEARALQDPVAHGFPILLDDAIVATKGIKLPSGATGHAVRGSRNGKDVVIDNGVITHRDFVKAKNWAQRSRSFGFNTALDDLPANVRGLGQ